MQQNMQDQPRAERIEALLQEIASLPDSRLQATVEELVQELLAMYGEGLAHILDLMARSRTAGPALVEALAEDELVGSLLLLHGLHPLDIEARMVRAIHKLEPTLKAHACTLELLSLAEGRASLRLVAHNQGCPSALSELRTSIEEALLQAVPDLEHVQLEPAAGPKKPAALPLTYVPPKQHRRGSLSATQKPAEDSVDHIQMR
ncbi:NifU family protein [Ktedonosporobacter rubrisoli]|uniref:NifU family protein n=1 Tax=Ktedonosporobacter rubrisoli TaxID=2509675 RepID=A0A4P6K309_KTERU|nr:NifU family protein [Ktedonosporobacter rubrisoli]QBD82549.1 NifU family protein [Ktedonosporobacter rubrisoli]